MKRTTCLLLLAALPGCGDAHLDRTAAARTVIFEMEAELALTTDRRATIWLPAPVGGDFQEVQRMQLRAFGGEPVELYDGFGNRILSVTGIPPLRLAYSVPVKRYRAEPPRRTDEDGELPKTSPWLKPAKLTPLEKVRKEALFKSAARHDVLGKARLLYDAVVDEIQYAEPDGGGWGRGDLAWVCNAKMGNSSDFHALFIAYCQSVGIPASFEVGYALSPKRAGEPTELRDYHCWARLQVPGLRRLPLDASEARRHPDLRDFYFGGLTEHRVRLTRGRDIMLRPQQVGPPLNFFVRPYAELGGKDVSDKLDYRVRFRDDVRS